MLHAKVKHNYVAVISYSKHAKTQRQYLITTLHTQPLVSENQHDQFVFKIELRT